MADQRDVPLSRGVPETVLPGLDEELSVALRRAAEEADPQAQGRQLRQIAADHPRCLEAWAGLAEQAADHGQTVESYAFARVGYHRGLDSLRASGWRGSGYVRWRHPENRGFLRSLAALQQAAAAFGETDEEERCRLFLHQLDPEWPTISQGRG